ncbi:MAG: hypothetical protein LLG03_00560, partial [Planctomycetaceae bacterium]|nr:hypothetical protein [Planctomycetaceae bacterium]
RRSALQEQPGKEGTAMDRTDAIAWVVSFCASLRLSQAKTLSELSVAGYPELSGDIHEQVCVKTLAGES